MYPRELVVTGKGGILPTPVDPFSAETLIIDGQSVVPNAELQGKSPQEVEEKALEELYPPIMTDRGPIYPARSIVTNPDGTVFLSAYPTDISNQRTPNGSANCTH